MEKLPWDIQVGHVRDHMDGVYVGRANPHRGLRGSPLGNPYRLDGPLDRDQVIQAYRRWLASRLREDGPERAEFLRLVELVRAGPVMLTCWCAPDPCHADIIKRALQVYLAGTPLWDGAS